MSLIHFIHGNGLKKPWQQIHIDFAGPFMSSIFLIVVDAHSKWTEIIPTSTTASSATVIILSTIFARFGLHQLQSLFSVPYLQDLAYQNTWSLTMVHNLHQKNLQLLSGAMASSTPRQRLIILQLMDLQNAWYKRLSQL